MRINLIFNYSSNYFSHLLLSNIILWRLFPSPVAIMKEQPFINDTWRWDVSAVSSTNDRHCTLGNIQYFSLCNSSSVLCSTEPGRLLGKVNNKFSMKVSFQKMQKKRRKKKIIINLPKKKFANKILFKTWDYQHLIAYNLVDQKISI